MMGGERGFDKGLGQEDDPEVDLGSLQSCEDTSYRGLLIPKCVRLPTTLLGGLNPGGEIKRLKILTNKSSSKYSESYRGAERGLLKSGSERGAISFERRTLMIEAQA